MAAVALVAAVVGAGVAVLVVERSDDDRTAAGPGGSTATTTPTDMARPAPDADPAVDDEADRGAEDWPRLFERVRSGVVRIRASSCEGIGAGTGFLVDGDRVATAAHVVAGAVAVSVETESGTYEATVERIDEAADLASLRLSAPDPGHVFDFAPDDPDPGTTVAVIGHPLDGPVAISRGTVSGIHRTIETEVGRLSGLLQTDAATNPGNSGGPVVTSSGDVAGVMSAGLPGYEGLGYAVESSTARPWFASAGGPPQASPATCQAPLGPDVTVDIPPPDGGDWVPGVAVTFANYFDGINTGDYQLAWEQLSPRLQNRTLDEFAAGVRTSYDFGFVVNAASYAGGRADVWLEFTSVQHPSLGPEPGESCTHWSLDYVLVEQPDGRFLIDQVTGHGGTSGHVSCL